MKEAAAQEKQPGFDLQVTFRDEKSDQITHSNPYTLRIIGAQDGGKTQLFERPVGSGNLWNKKGEPIGRWLTDEKTKKGKFIEGVAHVAFIPPETKDQKLAKALTTKDARINELEKELELIKAESKKKQGS